MSQYDNQNQFDHTNPNPYASTYIPPEYEYQQPVHVPDYLVWAILEAVCCCLPIGVVGIIYAVMANTEKSAGNYMKALSYANTAKTWLIVGMIGWVILVVLGIIANVMVVMLEMQQ